MNVYKAKFADRLDGIRQNTNNQNFLIKLLNNAPEIKLFH